MQSHYLMKPGRHLTVLLCGLTLAASAWCDDQSKDHLQLRHAQLQAQQLRQEKASLQAQLTALQQTQTELRTAHDKSVKQLSSALAGEKSASAHGAELQAALDAMTASKTTLEAQKKELEASLHELQQQHAQTQQALAQAQQDKQQLQTQLHSTSAQLGDSETRNFTLYKLGRDLIDQCRDKSATATVLRLEPFTGIRRVEIENQLEVYRDKLDKERLSTAAAPAGAAAP